MSAIVTFSFGIVLLILFGWYFATDKERAKRILGTALTVIGTGLAVFSFMPLEEKINLGIDLKGGTSFVIRLKPDETNPRTITKDDLDHAMEAIRKRVDSGGVAEPVIAPAGSDRILVQLPGVDPVRVAQYRESLQKVAKLEFRLVHPYNQRLLIEKENNPATFIDPVYEIVENVRMEKGKEVRSKIIVGKKVEMTGDQVKEAFASPTPNGGYDIHLSFHDQGAKEFERITKFMAETEKAGGPHMFFAILLDKVCISAPGLQEDAVARGGIVGGSCSITGNFEEKEARNIASALMNPLKNPVQVEEERSTSATLGNDAIQSGVLAGYIGAAVTVLVTLLYYRFAGLIANLALIVFMALFFGSMGMFNAVLTLPGIAGILLTLGMAIDANVLIYERLREEQAAGKSLRASLDAAYDKAFSAIFDSNVTTLITAGILYWKATGPVQGFAVSLIIGVVASMFTALIVTRNLFSWGMHLGIVKRITMVNLIPVTNFDFLGKRKAATLFSLVLMAASVAIFAMRGEKNFGVDFIGGDRLVMKAEGANPSLDDMRTTLEGAGYPEAVVQLEKSSQGEFIVIRDRENSAAPMKETLVAKFPQLREESTETVGAVVGRQLTQNSLIALVLGAIGILIYVTARFEFSFAVGAVVALLHDVVITVGVFSLMGRELSLVIVGAVLTVAGYSVNDTIVVYDRIREGIKAGRLGTIAQIMNASINETLSRTILTGGVTLLTTVALFFFGGPVLNDFALTILIGIIVGTYSSIFIAAPVVLWWSGRGGRDLKSEIKRGEENAVVPT